MFIEIIDESNMNILVNTNHVRKIVPESRGRSCSILHFDDNKTLVVKHTISELMDKLNFKVLDEEVVFENVMSIPSPTREIKEGVEIVKSRKPRNA